MKHFVEFDDLNEGMVFVANTNGIIFHGKDKKIGVNRGTQFTILGKMENPYDLTETGYSVSMRSQYIPCEGKIEFDCSYKFFCENFDLVVDAIGTQLFKCKYVKCRKDKHKVYHVEFEDIDNKIYKVSGSSDNLVVKKALHYLFECDSAEEFELKLANVEIELPIVEAQ